MTPRLPFVLCAALAVAAAPKNAPDTSLAHFPLAYYGANWNRSAENIELLSRLQVVILMQEDGPCWRACCPNSGAIGSGQCGAILTPGNDSSLYPGCAPSCDQLGSQLRTFEQLQAAAKADGRRPPHTMMYLNSVYLWPFDATAALGSPVMVVAEDGQPHAENCDPGIYPSYFWGWNRPAGQAAWLATVNRTILAGAADGAYIDCFAVPFTCNAANTSCVARRNGSWKSVHEDVTPATVGAYINGKLSGLAVAAAAVVAAGGTWFGSEGANMALLRVGAPAAFIPDVRKALRPGAFALASCHGQPWNDPQRVENMSTPVQCEVTGGALDTTCLAQFLLAVEPGLFLMCGGLLRGLERLPLGSATGPAARSVAGVWTRVFPSGTAASFDERTGAGNVAWAPTRVE